MLDCDKQTQVRTVLSSSAASPSSDASAAAPTPGVKRRIRVRRPTNDRESPPPVGKPVVQDLATDSLAYGLVLAARLLAAVYRGRSLNEALSMLAGEPTGARAAAQDTAYGTLRAYGRGEFILARLMERPPAHAETKALLLAALYRIETRPAAMPMVVDQAVNASGELSGGAFKGLVNAVLRNYLRRRDALLSELVSDDVAHQQHPAWWLARLRRAYPDDWPGIVAAGNGQPPMTLRVNSRRTTRTDYLAALQAAGMAARPVGTVAIRLESPVAVERLPGFMQGMVSVQDAGAQRAAELLDPAPGMRVLDACAAPGGKTAHLLERADLELLAIDVDAQRLRRVEGNLQRLGLSGGMAVPAANEPEPTANHQHAAPTAARVRLCAGDGLQPGQWWDGRAFDAILADVPCSASGVVRRHPDIKTLRRESDIRRLVHTQSAMLDALWPLLRTGGCLLYATCSVFIEENAAQIDAFLVRQPGARRETQEIWLPNDEHDGFFYALLRKT